MAKFKSAQDDPKMTDRHRHRHRCAGDRYRHVEDDAAVLLLVLVRPVIGLVLNTDGA